MAHEAQVVTTSARPTAVVAQATTWEKFPSVWMLWLDQVYAFLKTSDMTRSGHNVMLYQDDVPNVEVGVEVTGPFSPAGPVTPSVLPAGEAAMTIHRGPYDLLNAAHQAIRAWCVANGRPITGCRWDLRRLA